MKKKSTASLSGQIKTISLLFVGLAICSLSRAEESIKWNGDLRYRHEMTNRAGSTPGTGHFHRIMFRLGGKAIVNPDADVEFRVASGTGRQTANQTLGVSNNAFANYSIMLDRAFFDFHKWQGLNLYGGRVKNTFYLPGGSDLVWDTDVNFDGLALGYVYESGDYKLIFNQTLYWVSQGTINKTDNLLIAPQLGIKGKASDVNFGAAVAYYDLTHTRDNSVISVTGQTGNSNTGGATPLYKYDYRILDAGAELGLKVSELPILFYGDYVTNTAVREQKTGFLAGLKIGGLKEPGNWLLAYDYRKLDKDAVLSALADGDCAGGGSNIKNHRIKFAYQIDKNFYAGLTYYLGKTGFAPGETELKRNKLQADLGFAF